MPQSKIRARGGEIRVRTIRLKSGRYARVHVVRRKGPRGGRTILGKIRRRKA